MRGRLHPERCRKGWRTNGAIQQWIRNLRLAFLIAMNNSCVNLPGFSNNLHVIRNPSHTFTRQRGGVIRHSDRGANDRDNKLKLVLRDAD